MSIPPGSSPLKIPFGIPEVAPLLAQQAEIHRTAREIQAGAEVLEQLRADDALITRYQLCSFQQGRQHAEGERQAAGQ